MTTTLRLDRLDAMLETAAASVEAIPRATLEAAVPAELRAVLSAARLMRLDVLELLRRIALDSLRDCSRRARSDPETADAVARWLVHIAAYLTGQTDEPPPGLPALP